MSAQTETAPEKVSYDARQQTPVIIKNGDGVSDEMTVTIDSPVTYFTEWMPESPGVSQSICKGRLYELTIVEGPEKRTDYMQPDTEQLAFVKIEYGSVQLRVMESGNTATNEVVLVIESEIPFKVTEPGLWSEASAPFPPLTRVVFGAGNKVFVDREFTELERPRLVISFPRTTAE
jgi:hypothetical protein